MTIVRTIAEETSFLAAIGLIISAITVWSAIFCGA